MLCPGHKTRVRNAERGAVVAVSQAPSLESNPNSPLPVIATVGQYPTEAVSTQSVGYSAWTPKPLAGVVAAFGDRGLSQAGSSSALSA